MVFFKTPIWLLGSIYSSVVVSGEVDGECEGAAAADLTAARLRLAGLGGLGGGAASTLAASASHCSRSLAACACLSCM